MDTKQEKKIIATIKSVHANGDGTHKVLLSLDYELTAASGQYLIFSFERDGKLFEHKHVLGSSYVNVKSLEENMHLKTLEDELFIPVLKKGEVFSVSGPFNLTFGEKISRLALSGVNHKMLLVESLVIILIAGSTIFFLIKNIQHQEEVKTPVVAEVFVPKKTDYGTTTPPGFSTTTPIEKGVTLSQSYTKDYKSGQQSSVVIPSKKTVLENVAIYEKFLKNEDWKIIKILKNEDKSSISAEKSGDLFDVVLIKSHSTSTLKTATSYILLNTFKK